MFYLPLVTILKLVSLPPGVRIMNYWHVLRKLNFSTVLTYFTGDSTVGNVAFLLQGAVTFQIIWKLTIETPFFTFTFATPDHFCVQLLILWWEVLFQRTEIIKIYFINKILFWYIQLWKCEHLYSVDNKLGIVFSMFKPLFNFNKVQQAGGPHCWTVCKSGSSFCFLQAGWTKAVLFTCPAMLELVVLGKTKG